VVETVDVATGEVKTKPKRKAPVKKTAVVKPRTASLFKSMDIATIDLDTALRLLDLPRVVGIDPESGAEITAQNGRFGAYLKKGVDTRSLPGGEDQIFEIDLAGAIELYAQPKYGERRASSALKEFEAPDPESGKAIKIKDGRFGAYVTDGTTNATIPKAERIEDVDFDRAVQLLADKRAKGPAVKKTAAKKAPAKKAPVKKAPAKKAVATKPTASGATTTVRKAATPAQKAATAAKAAATRAANAAAKAAAAKASTQP
jgi:DNA topoisomerase-1